MPTRHCSSPSGSVDGRILVEEVIEINLDSVDGDDLIYHLDTPDMTYDGCGAQEVSDENDDDNDDDNDDAQEGGGTQDFTTITWQIGLGETLCYRFRSSNLSSSTYSSDSIDSISSVSGIRADF